MRAFSLAWKSSTRPSKQRKYRAKAPLHIKQKFLNVHLSSELAKKYKMRNLSIRVGDTIKILKGDFKGKEGKVERVDRAHTLVYAQGIERAKKDGTKSAVGIAPANLLLVGLTLDDKRRLPAEKK